MGVIADKDKKTFATCQRYRLVEELRTFIGNKQIKKDVEIWLSCYSLSVAYSNMSHRKRIAEYKGGELLKKIAEGLAKIVDERHHNSQRSTHQPGGYAFVEYDRHYPKYFEVWIRQADGEHIADYIGGPNSRRMSYEDAEALAAAHNAYIATLGES